MKRAAGEYTTSLVPQMKESALEHLETTWQTSSKKPVAIHKRQYCFCAWTVCIMWSRCALAIGICLLALHCLWQRKWTNQSGPAGEIVLRGPRRLASFYCCIAISVFLIDLYHLHWYEGGTNHSSHISRCTYLSPNSAEAVSDPFFSPRPWRRSHFYQQPLYFWQRGKPGQGVPLNGSNLEKWIEPGSLMACVAVASSEESGSAKDTWRRSS